MQILLLRGGLWKWAAVLMIAVQAVFLYGLCRANGTLRSDLAAEQAQTAKVQTAYDAYRLAADKMLLQMEEAHRLHHQSVHDLTAALSTDPLWARDRLPPRVREVLEQ